MFRCKSGPGRALVSLSAQAVVVLVVLVGIAEAALPPSVHEQNRRDAIHHIQVEVERYSGPAGTKAYGECLVEATVVRVFRDRSGTLAEGASVTFAVSCLTPDGMPPPGPDLWIGTETLVEAGYMEVYLADDGRGPYSVGARFIEAPSDEPQFPTPEAPE